MLAALLGHDEVSLGPKNLWYRRYRGAGGLVAVDDEGVVRRAFGDDGVGHGLGTEHGREAGEGDVGGNEEDG